MTIVRCTFVALVYAVTAILALILSACHPIVAQEVAAGVKSKAVESEVEVLQFDVSEDRTRFIFDKDVVYEDGLPADGSSFITRGYLYEPGTLEGSNGVNTDGSSEFPDKVICEWICQGYMINDAGHATGGVWVFSTQFFQIGDEPGAETIVTTGYELADLDVAIARAITGGTGQYRTGLNATEGVNLRVQIEMQK
jgi:hypothetical protein